MTWLDVVLWVYLVGVVSDFFASLMLPIRVLHAVVLAPFWPFTFLGRLMNRV